MSSTEEELQKAVVISVISDRSSVPGEEVAALLSPWLEVEEGSVSLCRLPVSSFLLFLPSGRLMLIQLLEEKRSFLKGDIFFGDLQTMVKVYKFLRRDLPCSVNFHLDGIPVHVWETAMVERLLNPFASVIIVQSENCVFNDLTSFRCST